jgi:hypothetical protein
MGRWRDGMMGRKTESRRTVGDDQCMSRRRVGAGSATNRGCLGKEFGLITE